MSLDRLVTRATLTPGTELELVAGDGRPDAAARPGGSRRRGRRGRAPAPRRRRRPGAGRGAASWTRTRVDIGGSTHSPGARGVAGTGGALSATASGSGSGSSGMSMSESSASISGGVRGVVLGHRRRRHRRGRLLHVGRAVLGHHDEGLAAPQRGSRATAGDGSRCGTARPADAIETPVAMRIATRTTATSRTAAPAVPRPACSGRPDDRAEVPARALQRVRVRERRRALGQLGQAADAEQAEHGARRRGATGRRPRLVVSVLVVLARAAVDEQRDAGAGGDEREERRGPSRPAARRPVSVPCPTGPSCRPHSASASRTPSVISPTAHRSRAWTRQNGGRAGARARPGGPGGGLLGGGAGGRTRGVALPRGSWSPQWGRDYCLTWSFLWTPAH